jgi:predicted O-methyltransferase YrrM
VNPRTAYARTVHGVGSLLDTVGVSRWLERRDSALARHVLSLGAIYDLDRMIALDVPWWTYPAIAEVDAFLADRDGKARVFEYGSGASTVWLAKRAGAVHSVEHDAAWASVLRPKLADVDHVELVCIEPDERTAVSTVVSAKRGHEGFDFARYVQAIDEVGGTFDVVVVDGRARSSCLEHALRHLADDGLIVFDNAARSRYRAAIEASGLDVRVRRGWAPTLPYPDATALLRPRGAEG